MKQMLMIVLVGMFGCNKRPPDIIIDTNVSIHYIDSFGKELFLYGTNGYTVNGVRLYYYNNGKQLVYTAPTTAYIPDYPFGYNVDSSTSKKYFIIFSDTYVVKDTAITYIDLKNNVEDTLKCSFTHPNSNPKSLQCDKVWYNGKSVSRSFDVVK